MQTQVGVREFKNGASRFIERVEAGEVLTVTRRGKAVARVIPAGMPPGISEMIGAGKARWNGRRPTLPAPIELRGEGPLASDYVIEGRR
ncbi:MAG: type II toxin-antitoxin system prevent-host-death family antitoxin [Actinomycetota bacterium]|nr:type II toxin-antitoxin system prevent-host-death family antitoxin [Actinomycetota bacterium]